MNCPKCGVHISPFDLQPNCKNCGVNIMFYSQEKSLERDAKRAELEFAGVRMVIARLKAGFIGSKIAVFRLISTLLCIAGVLIPFAGITVNTPVFSAEMNVDGIGVYNLFSGGTAGILYPLLKSVLFTDPAKGFLTELMLFFFLAAVLVLIFVFELLCFINLEKSAKKLASLSVYGIIFSLACFGASFFMKNLCDVPYASYKQGFGALVCAVLLAVNYVINRYICAHPLEVKYRTYDVERKETLKKVKAGEIDLDDLPIPVFETEEEKEQRIADLEKMLEEEEEENG